MGETAVNTAVSLLQKDRENGNMKRLGGMCI